MFASTVSGFADTPVSKYWIYFSLTAPIFISLSESQYLFELYITPQLTEWSQWWRLVLNQLIYVNQSEVLLSILLLYNLRVVERFYGSKKFLSLVLLVFAISTFLVPSLFYLLNWLQFYQFNSLPAGQITTSFALLYLYHHLVPVVYRFQISPIGSQPKWHLSDKTFVYIIALQLALFHLPSSLAEAVIGWTLSSVIFNEIIPGKNWKIPFYKHLHLETPPQEGTARQTNPTAEPTDNATATSTSTPTENSARSTPVVEPTGVSRTLSSQLFETFQP